LIVPAIDILGGKCVRLTRGDYASARVYGEEPAETARALEASGALWIHVVDLDAARGGEDNRDTIRAIRAAVACRLQCGGGIRDVGDVAELVEAGVDRLVVGTALVREPDLVARMAAWAPAVIVAGIDASEGVVRISGWGEGSTVQDTDLAVRCRGLGLRGIVYTSIQRDGTLSGPDVERTNALAAQSLPVLLSGGIGSEADVDRVRTERAPGVVGLIVGKALYEGRVDLGALVARHQAASDVLSW
jgi:phosphoribosylformimino-5-aminoimidazole carboxamide ribotide isomerase